ncbi:MAG: protein kinase domain-containing protein [Egibacteraceae bacterium]
MPTGYRVGGWEVNGGIASGSWGSVYAGRRVEEPRTSTDPPQGSSAALKFLPSGTLTPLQYAHLSEIVDREIRFASLCGQAGHPLLVRTFETLVVDDPSEPALHGAVVLAMERAVRSLADLLDAVGGEAAAPNADRLAAEICEGLAHMHASGWVHGDLKPSNVLLMADGSVRLADFGLTGELEGTHAYTPQVGSSDYLAPEWWTEQLSERGIASRTTGDIWAFGVTAHLLLSGGLFPFPGASTRARASAAQAYADGDAELHLADSLPPGWRSIIADCLAPDHATRSRHTAADLLARIHALRSSSTEEAPRAPGRRRVPSRAWPVAALTALILTITAGLLIRPERPSQQTEAGAATSGNAAPPATEASCMAQDQSPPHRDYMSRAFETFYYCSTDVGSELYGNIDRSQDNEPLDDTGFVNEAPGVWVICQRQGRANPTIQGNTNTWWLYTQGDRGGSKPNAYGYSGSWGYLPATAVAQGNQNEPVPGVPICQEPY